MTEPDDVTVEQEGPANFGDEKLENGRRLQLEQEIAVIVSGRKRLSAVLLDGVAIKETVDRTAQDLSPSILHAIQADRERFTYTPQFNFAAVEEPIQTEPINVEEAKTPDEQIVDISNELTELKRHMTEDQLAQETLIGSIIEELSNKPPYGIESIDEDGLRSNIKAILEKKWGTLASAVNIGKVDSAYEQKLRLKLGNAVEQAVKFMQDQESTIEPTSVARVGRVFRQRLWDASRGRSEDHVGILSDEETDEAILLLPYDADLRAAEEVVEQQAAKNPFKQTLQLVQNNRFVTADSQRLRQEFELQSYLKREKARLNYPQVETAIVLSGSSNVGVAGAESDIDSISYVHAATGERIPIWFDSKTTRSDFTGPQESSPGRVGDIVSKIDGYVYNADHPTPSLSDSYYEEIRRPGEGVAELSDDIYVTSLFNWAGTIQEAEGTIDKFRSAVVSAIQRHPHGEYIWNNIIRLNWQRLNVLYEDNITANKDRRPKVTSAVREGLQKDERFADLPEEKIARAEKLLRVVREGTQLPSLQEMVVTYL